MKRISFDRYKKEESAAEITNGIITGPMRDLMCDARQLRSVMQLVDKGTIVHWVSEGDWSMHQLLLSLLDRTGAADVYISSYAMGETPARVLAQLKEHGIITQLFCVLDNRVDVRTAGSLQLIKGICTDYSLVDTHAKVTLIINDAWQIAVIGSANYTENKRYEAGIISSNNEVVGLHLKWIIKALKDGNK